MGQTIPKDGNEGAWLGCQDWRSTQWWSDVCCLALHPAGDSESKFCKPSGRRRPREAHPPLWLSGNTVGNSRPVGHILSPTDHKGQEGLPSSSWRPPHPGLAGDGWVPHNRETRFSHQGTLGCSGGVSVRTPSLQAVCSSTQRAPWPWDSPPQGDTVYKGPSHSQWPSSEHALVSQA